MNSINIKKFPTVSVVIATYNSERTLDKCLSSVRNQNYPQKKIEIILGDGGSTDKTPKIAKKYHTIFLKVPKRLQNAEYNKGVGLAEAKGEFVLMIDHDNELPHSDWLRQMLVPLLQHEDIVASETLRYHYDSSFPLLDRYFALFGAGDPLPFYLGKADRLSYIYDGYNLLGKATKKKGYYVVTFQDGKIPTIGANGFLVRRKILVENADASPKDFFHIDVNVDLIRKGFNKYAFVDTGIIHHTGYKSIGYFLKRRILFMEQFYVNTKINRRYSVYTKGDFLKLLYFIFIAATFVVPTVDAVRGYIKIKDNAWFFHPILSFALLIIYGYTTIKGKLAKV